MRPWHNITGYFCHAGAFPLLRVALAVCVFHGHLGFVLCEGSRTVGGCVCGCMREWEGGLAVIKGRYSNVACDCNAKLWMGRVCGGQTTKASGSSCIHPAQPQAHIPVRADVSGWQTNSVQSSKRHLVYQSHPPRARGTSPLRTLACDCGTFLFDGERGQPCIRKGGGG